LRQLRQHMADSTSGRVELSRLCAVSFANQTARSALGRVRPNEQFDPRHYSAVQRHQKSSTSGRVELSYSDVLVIIFQPQKSKFFWLKRQQGIVLLSLAYQL